MERRSVRYPLPTNTIEWAIGAPAMLLMFGLLALGAGSGTHWRWAGFAIGTAFFTWMGDLFNRKIPTLRTRVRYLMCLGACAGIVVAFPLPFWR